MRFGFMMIRPAAFVGRFTTTTTLRRQGHSYYPRVFGQQQKSLSSLLSNRHFASSSSNNEDTKKNPIRWGILGAGKISSDFARAIALTPNAEPYAIAARQPDRAKSFCENHEMKIHYGNYNDLLQDPNVDVVYIGSIADQHYSLAKRSIQEFRKPTVVEKPFTLNHDDTNHLISLSQSNQVFLQEGMWTRFFPAISYMKQHWLQTNKIGDVVCIQGDFGWNTKDCPVPDDRIWNPKSGGMMLDIGMYLIQLGQIGFPNSTVQSIQTMSTSLHGVDHTTLFNIQYGNNNNDDSNNEAGFLQCYVTGRANTREQVVIQGTKGRIIVDSPAHVPTRITLQRDEGRTLDDNNDVVMEFPLSTEDDDKPWNYPGSVGFMHQVASVSQIVMENKHSQKQQQLYCPEFTHQDSLQVASIMDTILKQVKEQEQNDDDDEDEEPQTA